MCSNAGAGTTSQATVQAERDVVVVNDDCRRKEARRDADVDAAKETVMDRVDQYARERLERGGYIWTC